jgi:HEAT repeat protein
MKRLGLALLLFFVFCGTTQARNPLKNPTIQDIPMLIKALGSKKVKEVRLPAMEDKSVQVFQGVAQALRKVGKPSVKPLIKALSRPDGPILSPASLALGFVGSDAKEAVPALAATLSNKHEYIRSFALGALRKIGPNAQPAVPALIRSMQTERHPVARQQAITALGNIGPGAKPAVPALVKALLEERYYYNRKSAASALGRIGPNAQQAVPALVQAAQKDKHDFVRRGAAEALGGIGQNAKSAVPALAAMLYDKDSSQRRAAAKGLGGIGKPALPAIMKVIKDKKKPNSKEPRKMAVLALEHMGKDARSAVPILKKVAKEKGMIDAYALAALKKIDLRAYKKVKKELAAR